MHLHSAVCGLRFYPIGNELKFLLDAIFDSWISVVTVTILDIDECSTSARVCDVNAECQNTLGSYLCSCKGGFTGNGKTCSGRRNCPF